MTEIRPLIQLRYKILSRCAAARRALALVAQEADREYFILAVPGM